MGAKAAGLILEGHRAMHFAVASLNSAMPGCQMCKLYLLWPTEQAAGDQQHLNRQLFHLK